MSEPAGQPMVVMCAPNGARLGRAGHARVPITPAELADCAESLVSCGVSVMHLHVRDAGGGHSLDVDRYREAMDAVRARVGRQLILQVTTEAGGKYRREQQMDLVRALKPEAASVALNEICPREGDVDSAAAFYRRSLESGVWLQHILYSPEEAARFERLRVAGAFGEARPFVLFVLGRYAEKREGDPKELESFLSRIDAEAVPWSVCCFGGREAEAMALAAAAGGHVRIGFENNQTLPDGQQAPDNASLVRETLARIRKRPIADADWVRNQMMSQTAGP